MKFARHLMAMLGGTGGGLLVLMLALFVLTPSLDFECAVEGLPTANALSLSVQPSSVVEHSQPARGSVDHDKGVCPHGHCHHVSIAALRSTPMLIGSVVSVQRPLWATTPILISAAATRLDRPPRA